MLLSTSANHAGALLGCLMAAQLCHAQTLVVTPSTLAFNMTADSGVLPASQTIQVTSPNGSVPFICGVGPDSSIKVPPDPIFLSVSPTSGVTPATVTVSVLPIALSWGYGGYYNFVGFATATGASAGVPPVVAALLVGLPPPPAVTSTFNAASLQTGVSPGEIITIFGRNIGPGVPSGATASQSQRQVYISGFIDNTKVTFDGYLAPLLYASAGQINAVVPYEIAGQNSTQMIVSHDFVAGAAVTVPLQTASPAIFTITENGSGQGAILNQDNTLNGALNPAAAGSVIQIFGTGAGLWDRAVADGLVIPYGGPLPLVPAQVGVTIGGKAATVTYAGAAPGLVSGALQVDAVIPAALSSGPQSVGLTIGGASNSTQNVTVVVR